MSGQQQTAGPMSLAGFGFRVGLAALIWTGLALVVPPLAVETEWGVSRYAIVAVLWLITSAVLTGKSFGEALVVTIFGAGIYVGAWIVIAIILALIVGRGAAHEWTIAAGAAVGSLANLGLLYGAQRGTMTEPSGDSNGL